MKVWRILTFAAVLMIIGAPLVEGFMNWLAPAVRAGLLSLAPPAAAALAFVLYFNWRARLKSRILGDAKRDQELATAASATRGLPSVQGRSVKVVERLISFPVGHSPGRSNGYVALLNSLVRRLPSLRRCRRRESRRSPWVAVNAVRADA